MARLEEITTGSNILGAAGREPVSIAAVKWHGNTVLEITFKDDAGKINTQLNSQAAARRAEEAFAYNSLVIAWPEARSKAAELQGQRRKGGQQTLFDDKRN